MACIKVFRIGHIRVQKSPVIAQRKILEKNKANFAELSGSLHPSFLLKKFILFPAPTWEWSWRNSGEMQTTLWGLKLIIYMN